MRFIRLGMLALALGFLSVILVSAARPPMLECCTLYYSEDINGHPAPECEGTCPAELGTCTTCYEIDIEEHWWCRCSWGVGNGQCCSAFATWPNLGGLPVQVACEYAFYCADPPCRQQIWWLDWNIAMCDCW